MKTTLACLKGLLVPVFLFVSSVTLYAQTRTFSTTGNWETASNWTGNNIADLITEDASLSNNVSASVSSSLTVGNVSLGNGNTSWTITPTSTFNIGNNITVGNLDASNGGTVTINGNLTIWGNLEAGNNLTINVGGGGSLIIRGNVNVSNNASVTINGTTQVDGNFTASNNLTLSVTGSLNINGALTAGNNAVRGGGGTITAGSCSTGNTSFCSTIALPIQLLSFQVSAAQAGVTAKWITATEENNAYFTLERSADGKKFVAIATIAGAVNSRNAKAYQFTDIDPLQGLSYYRLRQTDLDGRSEVFPIKTVRLGTALASVELYPNPSQNGRFTVYNPLDQSLQATVYDQFGRMLQQTTLTAGTNTLAIHSANGLYIVQIREATGQLVENHRVIIH